MRKIENESKNKEAGVEAHAHFDGSGIDGPTKAIAANAQNEKNSGLNSGSIPERHVNDKKGSYDSTASPEGTGKEMEMFGKQPENRSNIGNGGMERPGSNNFFSGLRKLMPKHSTESLGAGMNNLLSAGMGSGSTGPRPSSTTTTNTSASGAPTPMNDIRSVADKAINMSKSNKV